MALLLSRDESISTIEHFRSIKKSPSTVVFDGCTYRVTADPSLIQIVTPTGNSSIKTASFKNTFGPESGLFSNGVMWRGEAFFFVNGVLWALDLAQYSWSVVPQKHPNGRPLWEASTRNDLLLMANEIEGTLIFARFRPSFEECHYVITYRMHILVPTESFEEACYRNARHGTRPDGVITIPLYEDRRNREEGRTTRRTPLSVTRQIHAIGIGDQQYPRSEEEAADIWKAANPEDELEKIRELREMKQSSRCTRECHICANWKPFLRAVYVECGHLICLACAKQLALEVGCSRCPFCQKTSKFKRIYEEEERNEE